MPVAAVVMYSGQDEYPDMLQSLAGSGELSRFVGEENEHGDKSSCILLAASCRKRYHYEGHRNNAATFEELTRKQKSKVFNTNPPPPPTLASVSAAFVTSG